MLKLISFYIDKADKGGRPSGQNPVS